MAGQALNVQLPLRPRSRSRRRSPLAVPFEDEEDDDNEHERQPKLKTVRALPPTRGLAGRFARLLDTRVFARLTIAGHRCFFEFQ